MTWPAQLDNALFLYPLSWHRQLSRVPLERMSRDSHSNLDLGFYPTPVRELKRLRNHLASAPHLWIKNDDYTGPGFGGNKVRKLEYELARAIGEGADEVITAGAVTSNHARVTAALCAQVGIGCNLVLNRPKGQPHPKVGRAATLMFDEMFGAKIHFVEEREQRSAEMERLAEEIVSNGRRAVVIPVGASTPLGALGFVRAAEELSCQASALGVQFRAVVHATSSGGTQAGLSLGAMLYCPGTSVIGVSVDEPAWQILEIVRPIATGAMELLRLPQEWAAPALQVDDRFTGPGYAIPSEEGAEAIALLARTEGVILDPVYTAKAMAGFLAIARDGGYAAADHLLFWHTGGQMALLQEMILD
jgi:D-cysteine desulfhydrase family pyridoxal phosphate-dependent enzyme